MNEYRPHQARETLIEMMEDQIRRGREETKGAKEMSGRVKEVLERVAAWDHGDEKVLWAKAGSEEKEDVAEDEEKMIWRILESEAGFT